MRVSAISGYVRTEIEELFDNGKEVLVSKVYVSFQSLCEEGQCHRKLPGQCSFSLVWLQTLLRFSTFFGVIVVSYVDFHPELAKVNY